MFAFIKKNKLLIIGAAVGVALFLGYTFFISPNRETKIDETENIVARIRKIGEFTSICFYEEIVVTDEKSDKIGSSFIGKKIHYKGTDKLVLIVKGRLRVGFDMTSISDDDIRVSGDSLFLSLPSAKIFDFICNPSDIEVFHESGKWSHEETVANTVKAKENLCKDAEEQKILEKATDVGIRKIESILKCFGYSNVIVSIK